MSDQSSPVVRAKEEQVMVSLPEIYEAADSATINGTVAFRDFYEIIRLNYPWPEERVGIAAQNSRTLSEEPESYAGKTTDHRTKNTPSNDYADDEDEVPLDLLIERRPPLKRSSGHTNTTSSSTTTPTTTKNRQGGPQHSANPTTGYVDILTPIVEKLEEDLQRLNLKKKYEKEGCVPRETWVPPPVEPGSPDSARGSYSRYYEWISSRDLGRRGDGDGDGDDDDVGREAGREVE